MSTYLHWHEGLFLQPHHLQTLQRNAFKATFRERKYSMAFPWGVISARLSLDDLEDKRIRFDHLEVALPSGNVFHFPVEAELPSLDLTTALRERSGDFMVYLAVPLWMSERANSIEYGKETQGQRTKMMFKVAEAEIADENTGSNPQPVQWRRLNGMLLLEDEDRSDMEFIPLLRVTREVSGEGAGLPKADVRFVPPTLLMTGSAVLMQMVRDLAGQTSAVRAELSTHLGTTPLDLKNLQGLQFEQLSRLRTINRFAARLPALLEAAGAAGRIPPFEVWLELKDFLSELTALYPAKADFDTQPYNHDDPWPPFNELVTKIRAYLGGVVRPRFRKVDFRLEDGLFVADISPEIFAGALGYFLGIETPADANSLARLVEDTENFKLLPASYGTHAIRGVSLKEERHPPFELPARPRLYYFRLDPGGNKRAWEYLIKEPQAIIHFERHYADHSTMRISLYITFENPLT